MKFAYTRFPSAAPGGVDAWRPIVKAKLFGPLRTLKIDMLLDSGSDESMVPASVLEAIGARFTGDEVEIAGIGGGRRVGRVAELRVEVAGHTFDARLLGVPTTGELSLLGQRDFFAQFVVQFDRSAGLFFVSRASRRPS